MKIVFIAATSHELRAIRNQVEKVKSHMFDVAFFSLGMGNISATYMLTTYLSEYDDIDFVCNIGICGYTENKVPLVQIGRTLSASSARELIVPVFFHIAPLVSIESFDLPVLHQKETTESYVDMESYGIAYVCEKKQLPHAMLKVPYDKIGSEDMQIFQKDQAMKLLEENVDYVQLLEKIVWYIATVPKRQDWKSIRDTLHLTFTEYENLKKLIARYEALSGKDFLSFFEENKHLKKDIFLRLLSEQQV